jgi:hypothetical protein
MLRFRLEYGAGITVAGVYSGNLGNGGEEILMLLPAPLDVAILRFSYSDAWYSSTDGDGLSLEIRDAGVHPAAWSDKESWNAVAPNPGDF